MRVAAGTPNLILDPFMATVVLKLLQPPFPDTFFLSAPNTNVGFLFGYKPSKAIRGPEYII